MILHPGCQICKETNVAQADVIDEETGKILIKKGSFAIRCDGIPANPEEHLVSITDPLITEALGGPDAIRKIARLSDPVLWAYDNITVMNEEGYRVRWEPRGATKENIEK